mmetsp:Transcript_32944/g.83631  ORF Transcript_32944/g.83631 Transcript_32944/m.83631 type:complete len:206 (+) Transcript_32944:171-788(+)
MVMTWVLAGPSCTTASAANLTVTPVCAPPPPPPPRPLPPRPPRPLPLPGSMGMKPWYMASWSMQNQGPWGRNCMPMHCGCTMFGHSGASQHSTASLACPHTAQGWPCAMRGPCIGMGGICMPISGMPPMSMGPMPICPIGPMSMGMAWPCTKAARWRLVMRASSSSVGCPDCWNAPSRDGGSGWPPTAAYSATCALGLRLRGPMS